MRKQILVLAVIISGMLHLSCSKDNNPIQSEKEITPSPKKEWTFLLYDDADFKDAYDPLNDFSKLVSSDSNINYLVLRDGNGAKANYYIIDKDHKPVNLKDIGEVNMGDKSTLTNFLDFAKKYFPANRYIVAFYDHGGGWQGTCWDVSSQEDNITPAEMNDAFTNFGGVDFALFTAPCLMGSIESAYQLRNSVKYYCGSEDLSGFIYWLGMLNYFDQYLKENIQCADEDVAKEIVALHDEYKNASSYGNQITISAVRNSKLSDLITSFDKVLQYYKTNPDNFNTSVHKNIKRYNTDYCDFYGLLKAFSGNEQDTALQKQIKETMALFNDCIISECHGDLNDGSYGLNIYLPQKKYASEVYYAPYGTGLDFKTNCRWEELLSSHLGKTNPVSVNENMKSIFKLDGKIPKLNK